jgi:hypothetical protein
MRWSMALAMRVRRSDGTDAEGVDAGGHEPVTTIASHLGGTTRSAG